MKLCTRFADVTILPEPQAASQSRALNPCGQEATGQFAKGNTCAAGEGSPSSGSGEPTGGVPPGMIGKQAPDADREFPKWRESNREWLDAFRSKILILAAKADKKIAKANKQYREALAVLDRLQDAAIESPEERGQFREMLDRYVGNLSIRFRDVAHIGGAIRSAKSKLQSREINYQEYLKAVMAAGEAAEAAGPTPGDPDPLWSKISELGPMIRESVAKRRAATDAVRSQDRIVGELYARLFSAQIDRNGEVHGAIGEQSAKQLQANPDGLSFPLRQARAGAVRRAIDDAVERYREGLEYDTDATGAERGGRRAIATALEFYGKIANLSTPQAERLAAARINTNLVPGQRAYARDLGDFTEISLSASGNVLTATHELGHAIEHGSGAVLSMAAAFQAHRCAGHESRSMREFGADSEKTTPRFDGNEIGNSDDFLKTVRAVKGPIALTGAHETEAAYIGKVYREIVDAGFEQGPRGKTFLTRSVVKATEIVSIGMELLYENPIEFAKSDPEYFDLMVAIATGAI